MTLWLISPHDTLVLRDGRELEGTSTPIRSMELPWPSTIAGFARSRMWSPRGPGKDVVEMHARELQQNCTVRGPWFAIEDHDNQVVDFAVPAPQDCVWHMGSAETNVRRRLEPVERSQIVECDLQAPLGLVGYAADNDDDMPSTKPAKAPSYWRWSDLHAWLRHPVRKSDHALTFGMESLLHEPRDHVSIDFSTKTAAKGMLFRTDHVRYRLPNGRRASIGFIWDQGNAAPGVAFVGGERRISTLRQAVLADGVSLDAPVNLTNDNITHLRVILLTPTCFPEGSVPKVLNGAKVVAAVVGRPLVMSGWDLLKNVPKHSRRLAPAGSVYWVEVSPGRANEFLNATWLQSVAPDEQDKRDGFGVAVVGVA